MRALLIFAGTALAFATPATAVELVTNGGFENGLTGFTQSGDLGFTSVVASAASQGSFGLRIGPVNGVGTISQSLATVAGQSYLISFDLANADGGVNSFDVDFGTFQLFGGSNLAAFDFDTYSATVIATGAITNLTFSFSHEPSYFYLDNVSVIGAMSAVPEPASWAMMLVGFAGAGMALRRRPALRENQAA